MAENKSEFEFEGQNDNYQNNNEIQQVNNTGSFQQDLYRKKMFATTSTTY
jgi:hypothetical protein